MMRSDSSKAYLRGDAVTHTIEGVHCADFYGFGEECKLSSVMTKLLQTIRAPPLTFAVISLLVSLNAK
jgi:hypothetical protein